MAAAASPAPTGRDGGGITLFGAGAATVSANLISGNTATCQTTVRVPT